MSAAPPNLIVVMSFNPTIFSLIGPVKASTVEQLNTVLPSACTTSKLGRRDPPTFQKQKQPNSGIEYWEVELRGQFCDQVGVSSVFCKLFDCLEEE
eukprot:gene12860-19822_t